MTTTTIPKRNRLGLGAEYKPNAAVAADCKTQTAAHRKARTAIADADAVADRLHAELVALHADTATDPDELAAAITDKDKALALAEHRTELAARKAKATENALRSAELEAFRADKAIRRRREVIAGHDDDTAELEAAFDELRAKIVAVARKRQFVRHSLSAELRHVHPEGIRGPFVAGDAELNVGHQVDQHLDAALDILAGFPWSYAISKAYIGEGGFDRLTDFEWAAADFSKEANNAIRRHLDRVHGDRWIKGEPFKPDRIRRGRGGFAEA